MNIPIPKRIKDRFSSPYFIKKGTYGNVYRVIEKDKKYAIKCQNIYEGIGISGSVLREIDILCR